MVEAAIGAVTVGSAVVGAMGQKKAGKKAKKLSRQQAETERFELEESLRRLDVRQDQVFGTQLATAGASGFDITKGSIRDFLKSQKGEMDKEREFAEAQGQRRIETILQGGQNAKSVADAAALGTLAGGVADAAVIGGSAYKDFQSAKAANPNAKWWSV